MYKKPSGCWTFKWQILLVLKTEPLCLTFVILIGKASSDIWGVCNCTQAAFSPWVSVWCMNLTSSLLFPCSSFILTNMSSLYARLFVGCLYTSLFSMIIAGKAKSKACIGCVCMYVCFSECWTEVWGEFAVIADVQVIWVCLPLWCYD